MRYFRLVSFTLHGALILSLLLSMTLAGTTDAATFSSPATGPLLRLVEGLVKAITYILFPAVAVYVVYIGFLFVAAGGNQNQLTKAKEQVPWAIGAILLLGMWTWLSLAWNTIEEFFHAGVGLAGVVGLLILATIVVVVRGIFK